MVEPPFREYHYIDIDRKKVDELEKLAGSRKDIKIYHGDCNKVLLNKVLPSAKYSDFRRALCILDPYGLHLDWQLLYIAGQRKVSLKIFLKNIKIEEDENGC